MESFHSNGSTASGSGLSNSMRTSLSVDQPVWAAVPMSISRSLAFQVAARVVIAGVVSSALARPSWNSALVPGLAPKTAATSPGTVQSTLPSNA
jgi:hypothetical protein